MTSTVEDSELFMDRASACLLGLAVGDAVGAAVEFLPRGRFRPLTDMTGGGKFRVAKGEWTDDTAMALCLADSLIACQGFDPLDQMQRYCRWVNEGYNATRPEAFGIGKTVLEAVLSFQVSGNPYSGRSEVRFSGNGSLMRIAPIAIAYANQPEEAWRYAALSSRVTHAAPACVQACQYVTQVLMRAWGGVDKATLLDAAGLPPLDSLSEVLSGNFKRKTADDVRGSGYVIASLEAALWAFWHTDSFRDAMLAAANLGDDADTTAAICGQIAGAHYGRAAIPPEWLAALHWREHIEQVACRLGALALQK